MRRLQSLQNLRDGFIIQIVSKSSHLPGTGLPRSTEDAEVGQILALEEFILEEGCVKSQMAYTSVVGAWSEGWEDRDAHIARFQGETPYTKQTRR